MFTLSKKSNQNYVAKIVAITNLYKHPNADRLQCTNIDGNTIITGLDTKLGDLVVYFPVECAIVDSELLSKLNLYKEPTLNSDPTKKGFMELKGRVKALRLRGIPSQGLILPLKDIVEVYNLDEEAAKLFLDEFDTIKGTLVVKKYTPKINNSNNAAGSKVKKATSKYNLVDNQFRFHIDTPQLGKNLFKINPNDLINITRKVHGTSGISSNILVKRDLSWLEKLAKKLGVHVKEAAYTKICSSRKVIKTQKVNTNVQKGYYDCDIWNIAHKKLQDFLTEGLTLYYEIIGFLPNGKYIQKDFDYGCVKPHELRGNFVLGTNYKIKIYRITYTNVQGVVHEFSAKQVQDWCLEKGLDAVEEFYYGYAKDLYPNISTEDIKKWRLDFLDTLKSDKAFNMEQLCVECDNDVPNEGVVIRKEVLNLEVLKQKCFLFLEKETKQLDAGIVDIETIESE